jgi:hypothetical protein
MKKSKKKRKKRLCVFYVDAHAYYWKDIEWIVCKECQRFIQKGIIEVPAPESRR